MSKSLTDRIDYAVYCVNEFARSNSLSYRDAFDYLDRYQAIDYITDFYVENSQQPMRLNAAVRVEARWYDISLPWHGCGV